MQRVVSLSFFFLSVAIGMSDDCPKVEKLALGLHMDAKQPELMKEILLDCCFSTGIQCRDDRVAVINWSGKNLDGEILGDAIPDAIERLFLGAENGHKNDIQGNIPVLPDSLQYFYADSNSLNGTIPSPLPTELVEIVLNFNKLTGNIPYPFPAELKAFQAPSNKLSGPFPPEFNEELEIFSIWANLVTGKIPAIIPSKMWVLYISGNRLYGDVPSPFPDTMKYLALGNAKGNRFTGTVQLNKPVYLALNHNYITNVVLSDASGLNYCDISYNPLLEHFDDVALAKCKKIGLYSAYSLPNTVGQSTVTATSVGVSKTVSDDYQPGITQEPYPDLPPPVPSHSFKDIRHSKAGIISIIAVIGIAIIALGYVAFRYAHKEQTITHRDFELLDGNNEEADQLIK
eukprot:NODE_290_length_11632_cov_0.441256.p4 type:complete len:401 gc:universal NODE_290_length_11632_cov_0.441256:11481-10279(-)